MKELNLNLITKKVQVGTFKVKCAVTRQQIEDLEDFSMCLMYKLENNLEKSLIEKYFRVELIKDHYIYYKKFNKKELRKIKLLILKQDEFSELFSKIIDNSKIVNLPFIQDIENDLVQELSKQINNDILKNIMKLK